MFILVLNESCIWRPAIVHDIFFLPVLQSGMDTQLVVLPLLDKVEKNTPESAIRKIVFPHVRTHLVDYSTSLTPSLQPFASNTMYTSNHLEAAPMETFLPLSVFLSREAWFVVRRKRGCCSSSSPIIWSCGESGRAMVMVRKTHTSVVAQLHTQDGAL